MLICRSGINSGLQIFGSFLDEDSVIPNSAQASRPRGEEKCYFGQRRPMLTVASGLHQLDEPIAHLSRVWTKISRGRLLRGVIDLFCGPGWTTAGLRRRQALPETSSAPRVRLPRTTVSFGTQAYVAGTSAVAATLTTIMMVDPTPSAALGVTLVIMLLCQAQLLDGAVSSWIAEITRVLTTLVMWWPGGSVGGTALSYGICAATVSAPVLLFLDLGALRSKRD